MRLWASKGFVTWSGKKESIKKVTNQIIQVLNEKYSKKVREVAQKALMRVGDALKGVRKAGRGISLVLQRLRIYLPV